MSVKVSGLVWDLELTPNKKLTLLAYADHADHDGRNIFPSVELVAKKTGYSERSIQRITRELETDGLLVADGTGRRGTNRWKIPLDMGGDNLSGVTSGTQRGDIPSGDIPSGDMGVTLHTEPSEPSYYDAENLEPVIDDANKAVDTILDLERMKAKALETKQTYLNRDKFAEQYWTYCDAFVKATGMKPLASKVINWSQAFDEWQQLEVSVGDILFAVQLSKGDEKNRGFHIASPHSLTNTLNRLAGERSGQSEGSAWEREMERLSNG